MPSRFGRNRCPSQDARQHERSRCRKKSDRGTYSEKTRPIGDVATWRKPDRVFDEELIELDLGDRKVELWHFGPGNTPGDAIVYMPEAKTAWTGNFLSNERIENTMLLEGGPREYIDTLARCKSKLDIKQIIPGHGPMGKPEAIDHLINYLWWLLREVDEAIPWVSPETPRQ